MTVSRRSSLFALLGLVAAGCGGGGGGGSGTTPTTTLAGSVRSKTIASTSNGTTYPLSIYLPPDTVAVRANLPTVYLLDGESRFQTMVDVVEAMHAQVMIVAIGNEALRARDYVPANLCTPGGGGQGAFLNFIVLELVPFVEGTYPADPLRRILLGHSHGGSFVLYALFNEAPASRHFGAYLSADPSIDCMGAAVYGWEAAYAAANTALAVRLHLSYSANNATGPFGSQVQSRHYNGLSLVDQAYPGGHIGMIPAAFSDGLAFGIS